MCTIHAIEARPTNPQCSTTVAATTSAKFSTALSLHKKRDIVNALHHIWINLSFEMHHTQQIHTVSVFKSSYYKQ